MKKNLLNFLTLGLVAGALTGASAQEIKIEFTISVMGQMKPIPVALDGFTGEGAEVLKFDLYVQGFSFVSPDAAQYLIHGSDSLENAQMEIGLWFKPEELLSYSLVDAAWIG